MTMPTSWKNTTFEAVRCFFYVGVREIAASVQNGTYHEVILHEVVHAENMTGHLNESSLESLGATFRPDFAQNSSHSEFKLLFTSYQNLVSSLSELIGSGADNIIRGDYSNGYSGPEILRMLYAADNTTKAMENMAHYMTIALRANDTILLRDTSGNSSIIAPSHSINGAGWDQAVFIQARWVWLVLPATILALVVVLLFCVITRSQPDQVGTWKSSPLALFLHAEGRGVADEHKVMPTADTLRDVAAGLEMQILRHEKGGHLVRTRPVDSKIR